MAWLGIAASRGVALVGLLLWPGLALAASSSEHYRADQQLTGGGNQSTSSQYSATETLDYIPATSVAPSSQTASTSSSASTGPRTSSTQPSAHSTSSPESAITTPSTSSPSGATASPRIATTVEQAVISVGQTVTSTATAVAETVTTVLTSTGGNQTIAALTIAGTLALGAVPAAASGVGSAIPIAQSVSYAFNTLFGWRRRRGYGRVYDALTHKPVASATVRLLAEGGEKFAAGKLVAVATTDADGRYRFETAPGEYRLEVVAGEYRFPAASVVTGYHGEHVRAQPGGAVNPDVPLDGKTVEAAAKRISFAKLGRVIQFLRIPIMVAGTGSAIYFVATQGARLDYFILAGYLVIWVLELWSFVRAHQDAKVVAAGQPVDSAIVRLYGEQTRLLGTVVSQQNGRFALFAPAGQYELEVVRPGYESTTKDVRLSVPSQIVGTVHLTAVQVSVA